MEKKKLYIKSEWIELMEALDNKEFRDLIVSIKRYEINGEEFKNFSPEANVIVNVILKDLERAKSKREFGALGGNPYLKKKNGVKEKSEIDPTLFEIFWGEYPKRVGKTYARQCFYKLKPTREMLEKMISAIREQKNGEQWKSENGKFIPNPATWLNQGRWMDEVRGAEGDEFKEMKIGIRL